jgi:hypothetical protein
MVDADDANFVVHVDPVGQPLFLPCLKDQQREKCRSKSQIAKAQQCQRHGRERQRVHLFLLLVCLVSKDATNTWWTVHLQMMDHQLVQ